MIELAKRGDGPAIMAVSAAVGIFTTKELNCIESLWALYEAQGEESGYTFLVYRENQGVAGYACFGPHPLTNGVFDLYWIAVDPRMQGRGIGHALLQCVEREVRMRGGRMVLVETSGLPAYASARRLYESCGYRYEGVVHDFYDIGDDLILFAKEVGEMMPEYDMSQEEMAPSESVSRVLFPA